MKKRVLYLGLLLSIGVFSGINSTLAQRQMPTGDEIARAAKAAKLNPRDSATSKKYGMTVKVTPMDLSNINTPEDIANGQVVAVVDVKGVRDLPDGEYNVFVVKVNNVWQESFEFDGKIVGQAKRLEVSSTKPSERQAGTGPMVVLSPGGCWCVSYCPNGNSGFCLMCQRCN